MPYSHASMGPRPDGRGETIFVHELSLQQRLQWGRDLTVAESGEGEGVSIPLCLASMGPRPDGRGETILLTGQNHIYTLLQWGRDLTVAERIVRVSQVSREGMASMGPRPDGRGENS